MAGKIDDARARELYAEGKSDREIGEAFGVTSESAWFWRTKNGLKANIYSAQGRRTKTEADGENRAGNEASAGKEKLTSERKPKKAKPELVKESPPQPPSPQEAKPELPKGICTMRELLEAGPGKAPEMKPAPDTPPARNLDPDVYLAFQQAVVLLKQRDGQPELMWRRLLDAVEHHSAMLSEYMGAAGTRAFALQMAALAAVEEMPEGLT